jgi:hypothetical protein
VQLRPGSIVGTVGDADHPDAGALGEGECPVCQVSLEGGFGRRGRDRRGLAERAKPCGETRVRVVYVRRTCQGIVQPALGGACIRDVGAAFRQLPCDEGRRY